MTDKPLEQMGLRDLRGIMRQQAPAEAWTHFNGAAETKSTFHRNPRAFQQYLISPENFPRCQRAGYFRRAVRQDVADSGDHGASGKF